MNSSAGAASRLSIARGIAAPPPLAYAQGPWQRRWGLVFVFAVAMAWVESAVVYYLRTMIDRIDPYQANPLPNFNGLVFAELVREFATLVMLATVGGLAGRTWKGKFGYALLAFGVWDIFYYVFLRCVAPWPRSILDWDILFLLPLPWWGPVLAPVLIAGLMVTWGTLHAWKELSPRPGPVLSLGSLCIPFAGALLALYSFMEASIHLVWTGSIKFEDMLPQSFNWPVFLAGFAGLAWPVARMAHFCRTAKTDSDSEQS